MISNRFQYIDLKLCGRAHGFLIKVLFSIVSYTHYFYLHFSSNLPLIQYKSNLYVLSVYKLLQFLRSIIKIL